MFCHPSVALLAVLGLAQAAPYNMTMATTTTVTSTVTVCPSSSLSSSALSKAGTTTATSSAPSSSVSLTGVKHVVTAGFNGLNFEPDNIVAQVGDVVEVHFRPMNHSFAQSSFAQPCKPINDNAFFSGFMPTNATQGENPTTFTIEVTDNKPVWFYCSQTKGSHCQMGMAGVINQDFNSPNTLDAYKRAAALTGTSISPPRVQGGTFAPNTNPF